MFDSIRLKGHDGVVRKDQKASGRQSGVEATSAHERDKYPNPTSCSLFRDVVPGWADLNLHPGVVRVRESDRTLPNPCFPKIIPFVAEFPQRISVGFIQQLHSRFRAACPESGQPASRQVDGTVRIQSKQQNQNPQYPHPTVRTAAIHSVLDYCAWSAQHVIELDSTGDYPAAPHAKIAFSPKQAV